MSVASGPVRPSGNEPAVARSHKPRPTVLQGAALVAAGLAFGLPGLFRLNAAFTREAVPPLGPLVALCFGALLFALGVMLLLVALVRPLFTARPVDDAVNKHRSTQA